MYQIQIRPCFSAFPSRLPDPHELSECPGGSFYLLLAFHMRLHRHCLAAIVEGKRVGRSLLQRQAGHIENPGEDVSYASRNIVFRFFLLVGLQITLLQHSFSRP